MDTSRRMQHAALLREITTVDNGRCQNRTWLFQIRSSVILPCMSVHAHAHALACMSLSAKYCVETSNTLRDAFAHDCCVDYTTRVPAWL